MLLLVLLLSWAGTAQQPLPEAPKPQNNAPPPRSAPPQAPTEQPAPLPQAPPAAPTPGPNPDSTPPGPPPAPGVATTPPNGAPAEPGSPRDQLPLIIKNVNFVLVPVTVKDSSGHLVDGLLSKNFSVYENGTRQNITFFTSDPFPLSAAVVLETALAQPVWDKVRETLPALAGAFGQFDELALFTYGNTVRKVQDFTGINASVLDASLRQLKRETSDNYGVPVLGGPIGGGTPSPSINGRNVETGAPTQVHTMPKRSFSLNDAILAAANELGRRDPTRRKIIFVVSDGREVGSAASYSDVLRVLLTRQISVYAVGVGGAGIPGYRTAQKIRIPGQGYGNILPKYAAATGGQVFSEFDQQAIETAYASVTSVARNQYTVGYSTRATPSTAYRDIEVRVDRPSCKLKGGPGCVDVVAKDGYYPLPPGKQ
jgi:VWFA-related protein